MFTFSYYSKFRFEYLTSNNYNPQLYNSVFDDPMYNNNIITTTVTLVTNNLIAVNLQYSAYDFYKNNGLLIDMYNMYKNLSYNDNSYLVYNSLEVGSLPEVYHYHIQKAKLMRPHFQRINSNIKGFYKVSGNTYANMYCIKINEFGLENLFNLFPKFAYECREVSQYGNIYKYSMQIFFYCIDLIDCMFFSFKKTNVINIYIQEDGILPQQYWDDIYGTLYQRENIIYLPVGIVIFEGTELNLTNSLVTEMKSLYHEHPNINGIMTNILSSNLGKVKAITKNIRLNPLRACMNIEKQFENAIFNKKNINIICKRLPYLYKLNENDGLIYVNGNKYFITTVNETDIMRENNYENYIYPLYYGKITHNNKIFEIYQEITTYFDTYIDFEEHNLRSDNNIINAFVVCVFHNLIYLKKNIMLYIIFKIYLTCMYAPSFVI